ARKLVERRVRRQLLALAGLTLLEFDDPLRETARADGDLPGEPDQVHGREFGARGFVTVVVKHLGAGGDKLSIEIVGSGTALLVGGGQIDQRDLEGRHGFRPDNAVLVVARLDDGADETRDADAVRSHLQRHGLAVRPRDGGVQRLRVFRAEIEDVPDLDPAGLDQLFLGGWTGLGIVFVVSGSVKLGPLPEEWLEIAFVVDGAREDVRLEPALVAIDGALASLRQDDELVAQVSADGSALRAHRYGLQA